MGWPLIDALLCMTRRWCKRAAGQGTWCERRWRSPPLHERLDLIGRARHLGRELRQAGFCQQERVLDADPDVLVLLHYRPDLGDKGLVGRRGRQRIERALPNVDAW